MNLLRSARGAPSIALRFASSSSASFASAAAAAAAARKTSPSPRIGFIGAGRMAQALMGGLVRGGVCSPGDISCSDAGEEARRVAEDRGHAATSVNSEVCLGLVPSPSSDSRSDSDSHSDSHGSPCSSVSPGAVVLAVKPHVLPEVLADVRDAGGDALLISIAAGVPLSYLEGSLPGRRIVRVMPNTPCLVGEAASAYALGGMCGAPDRALVEAVLGAVGTATEVREDLLDAVTGLSGSGPAYAYQFIEALSDGGVRAGLPRDVATMLAAQTVKGAAEMVLRTGHHPGLLKDGVTSPGGTTIAGVEALENGCVRVRLCVRVRVRFCACVHISVCVCVRGSGCGCESGAEFHTFVGEDRM